MKVILLHDVPKIGRKYEKRDVKSGFARNFLIPRGLAEMVTSQSAARVAKMVEQADAEVKIQEDLLEKNIESLERAVVVIGEKANDKGHLFAGVHKEEIAAELKRQGHIDMPSDYIQLQHPIKEIGEFDIKVKVKEKTARFKLKVEAVETSNEKKE